MKEKLAGLQETRRSDAATREASFLPPRWLRPLQVSAPHHTRYGTNHPAPHRCGLAWPAALRETGLPPPATERARNAAGRRRDWGVQLQQVRGRRAGGGGVRRCQLSAASPRVGVGEQTRTRSAWLESSRRLGTKSGDEMEMTAALAAAVLTWERGVGRYAREQQGQ
ncbi:hypothetical protein BDA96_02G207300 [Sorghum bicolor]|uniref:Uncharacterized protein n=1 Tax=Sorghum bicolor TaxID=4558 RepID=A0A921RPR5_SORBI|nr:hypothetical protein BDA96_02G207300 [Sorghum bicolor]